MTHKTLYAGFKIRWTVDGWEVILVHLDGRAGFAYPKKRNEYELTWERDVERQVRTGGGGNLSS